MNCCISHISLKYRHFNIVPHATTGPLIYLPVVMGGGRDSESSPAPARLWYLSARAVSAVSADSPVGCRGKCRRAILGGTSHAFGRLVTPSAGRTSKQRQTALKQALPMLLALSNREGRALPVGASYGIMIASAHMDMPTKVATYKSTPSTESHLKQGVFFLISSSLRS